MFKDVTYLEAVMFRYKLGLEAAQAWHEFELPVLLRPSWHDRFLVSLGKTLIVLGARLQQRHAITTPAAYRRAYPTG